MDNGRKYGIDLLRVISMVYVVILHTLGHGGILSTCVSGTYHYKTMWFLEILAYVAVDLFAMITGYVCAFGNKSKISFNSYMVLYITVLLYSIILYVLIALSPFGISFSLKEFLKYCFPITNDVYWYFTQYTVLVVASSLILIPVGSLDKKTYKLVIFGLFFLFSVLETITGIFKLSNGYSSFWLIFCFIIGYYIAKYDFGKNIPNYIIIVIMILLYIITWGIKISEIEFCIFDYSINKDVLVKYTSPTIVAAAVCYMILFSKIEVNKKIKGLLRVCTPSVFSVYLMNDHPIVRSMILQRFSWMSRYNTVILLIMVLIYALAFTALAIIIDQVRVFVIKRIKIKDRIDKAIDGILGLIK